MADDDLDLEGGGELEESGEKKKSPMMLIIIIAAVVLLLGGGAAGYFFFMTDDAPPAAQEGQAEGGAEGQAGQEGEGAKKAEKGGAVVKLDPFIVNLADPTGKRYLKLSLAVDTTDEKTQQELEGRMPQIRDSILLLLTSKSYADISSVAGKIRLRNEVLQIINRALKGVGDIHAVYFTEFVIQ